MCEVVRVANMTRIAENDVPLRRFILVPSFKKIHDFGRTKTGTSKYYVLDLTGYSLRT